MLSNIQQWLMKEQWLRILFDLLYLFLPVFLTILFIRKSMSSRVVAYITAVFTLIYGVCFSACTYISVQGYMSWILFSIILSSITIQGFYYNLHAVRIIFILMFVSSALFKISSGGVFNEEQMAAILITQHNSYLVGNANDTFTKFIYFLVQHKALAQGLFLLATIAELLFVIGLFTRKFDRILIITFCGFLIFDYFLMQINYFPWLVFIGCFYFSKYKIQEEK